MERERQTEMLDAANKPELANDFPLGSRNVDNCFQYVMEPLHGVQNTEACHAVTQYHPHTKVFSILCKHTYRAS
jgi:hypothetical protein